MTATESMTMHDVLDKIAQKLEAWADGEKAAQVSAEERGDRHAAEGHWHTKQSYDNMAALARKAMNDQAR